MKSKNKKIKLHHVAKVVNNIKDELEIHSNMGFKTDKKIFIDKEQKVRIGKVYAAPLIIELLEPLDETSPIWKFYQEKKGLHHICIEVNDIDEYLKYIEENNLGCQLCEKTTSVFEKKKACFIATNNRDIIELIEPKPQPEIEIKGSKNYFSEEEKKEKIIFRTDDKDFKFDDIVHALKQAGIKKGDVIMVQSDLGVFGKLGDIMDRDKFANAFIEAFLTVLGEEGTMLVPTFTYSFCKNEIYDPDNTSSVIGLLPEEFRKRKDAFRSINPIFSIAAIGKQAKELTTNLSKNSFGKGSIYDKLQHIKDSKYVVFGVNYFACTHVHYVERMIGVPYRFVKKFKGKIKFKGGIYEDEYEFYVRHLNRDVNTTFDKIEKHLYDNNLLKKVPLGNNFINIVKINDVFKEGVKMLKKDPIFFLKNKFNI